MEVVAHLRLVLDVTADVVGKGKAGADGVVDEEEMVVVVPAVLAPRDRAHVGADVEGADLGEEPKQ